jgi:UDP-glucose-4-epimerase GalE
MSELLADVHDGYSPLFRLSHVQYSAKRIGRASGIYRQPGGKSASRKLWNEYNMGVPKKKRILVTGGAGYIGSNTTLQLLDAGYDVVVADNLSRGHRETVEPARLREVDLLDTEGLVKVMNEAPCEAVIHFAAYIAVGESMKIPEVYFRNNVAGSLSLLTAMVRAGIGKLVFSSTAAVYGMPERVPIAETEPYAPVNAYGESKVMVEKLLHWFDQIHGLRSICLRYFNAAGADPGGRAGESHEPETHLIPLLFRAIRTGVPVTLYGDDYDTPDGTCIRDYIHVTDLAGAHMLAVEALAAGSPSRKFNAGTGRGFSVREVLRAVEEVTGSAVPHQMGPRRDGDPPMLVADSGRLQQDLGWVPKYSDIRTIVETGWRWETEGRRNQETESVLRS